jgi:hypothetical protein
MKYLYFALWVVCALFWSVWLFSLSMRLDPYACQSVVCDWMRSALFLLLLPCAALYVALTMNIFLRMIKRPSSLKVELATSAYTLLAIAYTALRFPSY